MIRTHTLNAHQFDDLAAGHGGAATIRALRSAQVSRRLLLLRGVLDATPDRLTEPYRLLAAAQRADPAVVTEAVAAPHFGAWVVTASRTTRGAIGDGADPLDHLAAIAAAAAARAGLDFTIEVAAVDGGVYLPGLGWARTGPGRVVVAGRSGDIRVGPVAVPANPAIDGPDWQGLRRLRAERDGLILDVRLDDLDPYRDTHRLNATGRLSAVEANRWQQILDPSWHLLVEHHRRYAEAIAAGLLSIVPLTPPASGNGVNGTSMHAFGSVSLTLPRDDLGFASSLLHEFQHAKLGALLDLFPLYTDDAVRRHYAPWRDDPRPLGGLLQGVYAFLGVTDFWRVQRAELSGARARFAHFEFARWRERVWRTFQSIERSGRFDAYGRRFLDGMRATQQSWLADPVPAELDRLAAEAAEDHWAGWRLRNLRLDPEQLGRLADAWMGGEPAAPGTLEQLTVRVAAADVRALARNVRLDLALQRMAAPARPAGTCAQPGERDRTDLPGTPGDHAYARGDFAAAVEAYREQIAADPDDRGGWLGLTLACRRCEAPADEPWHTRPEIPFALHCAVRAAGGPAPDPIRLGQWLAGPAMADQATEPR
ncbi:HEXXH motif domain-containing protein [Micromonospora sp. NPDC049903]|uniref:HEXXH motif domain-containing protein n=1 Tax=Micromonospora sp. NPDC049903 TaxID=3364276 RepID=UPI0037B9804A